MYTDIQYHASSGLMHSNRTRRHTVKAAAIVFSIPAISGLVGAQSRPSTATAHLSGAAHDLDRTDTRARGQTIVQVRGDEARFRLNVANIEDVLMAHIHLESVTGPVSVWLHDFETKAPLPIAGRVSGVLASGTITDDDVSGPIDSVSELLDEILAGDAFVNVHTEAYPGGEIGGQLRVSR